MFPGARQYLARARACRASTSCVRTWERGAGLTKACGSAACAAAVAAARLAAHRPQGDGDAAGRRPPDRMARARRPRADDRPGRLRIRRPLRSGAVRQRGRGVMGVDVVTFGCRLNAYESEVIRRKAQAAGPRRHRGRQHLRGDRRGGAAGAAGDPQARARAAGRAHRGHRLRGADRARDASRPCRRSAAVIGNEEKLSAEVWRAHRDVLDARAIRHRAREEKIAVNDIMAVTRDRRASDRRRRGPRARLRAGAERLRPPLHLLHHPLRPRQFALGADGRGGRAGAPARASAAIARSCSPASTSPATARTCRARRGSARW